MKKSKTFSKIIAILTILALLCTGVLGAVPASAMSSTPLPAHIVIGYWENWVSTPRLLLRNVPAGWDVVNVSFMLVDSAGYTATFTPDSSLYPGGAAAFKSDVEFCQARGQKVVISFGGADNFPLSMTSESQRNTCLSSIKSIVDYYGFDGFDIDFERTPGGAAIMNVNSSDSMANPSQNIHKYMIYICQQLAASYGSNFIISMAPEHPYVQGGSTRWGDYSGGYLPLLYNIRDILTYIHPQYYNNSINYSSVGASGYNANSLVKCSEMLINGFRTANGETFPGLRPDQVAFGVLLGESASSGTMSNAVVASALDTLLSKYPTFRGAMTWSLNADVRAGNTFLTAMETVLDNYDTPATISVASLTSNKSGTVPSGTAVTFSTTVANSNGTVQYQYELYKNGTLSATRSYSTSASYAVTLNDPGTYTVKVTVKDSSNVPASAEWTTGVTVVSISVASLTSNKSGTVPAGTAVTFSTTVANSNGTVQYQYELYKNSALSATRSYSTSASYAVTLNDPGTYTVKVTVKDSSSVTASSTWNTGVTVQAPLAIPSVSASKTGTVAQGTAVNYTINAAGGTPSYSYSYYVLKGGKVYKSGAYQGTSGFTFTPTEAGSYQVRSYVKDSNGKLVELTSSLVVS
ncbi:MAG: hypothetical protein LBS74_01795 [Oscillospiraceae bacterium]|jgi:chitinase|nr:hypothetical protein [Oscillospiraceae bacterium]